MGTGGNDNGSDDAPGKKTIAMPALPQTVRRFNTNGLLKPPDKSLTRQHAAEVRRITHGEDVVDDLHSEPARRQPKELSRKEMVVVKSWVQHQPLVDTGSTPAMIEYPRMWNTRRGRYCKFRVPGAGTYGLLRARSTF